MPSFCAVVNCNDRYGHSENISFHKFPFKRPDLLKQWEAFIQRQRGTDWRASRWSSLCSRHFCEDDFKSLNERKTLKKSAVPSILDGSKDKQQLNDATIEAENNLGDKEFKEILAIREQLEDVGNTTKTNCRLCGGNCTPVVTFATNYELYGTLQKCFPTLNIQQEDALPKVLCASCNKNLQQFGDFVDMVWAAQTELQRKYRTRTVEKPLKIKQEPLVRVKQEVAEVGYDQQQELSGTAGNDDYEMMAEGPHEDGGEDSVSVDHKYEFCDFPIINDCDIMEIINLDDPFINIPDDDNTTTVNEEQELQKPINDRVNYMPSAHELLQAHMLMDEHNYAYVDTEDFKEERQVYKTEKSDGDERINEMATTVLNSGHKINEMENISSENLCPQMTQQHPIISEPFIAPYENRALKPIVTSVSAIQQPTSKAHGIVVLNESIVKSGCGFQLHACMVCHLKFFTIASLKEHYTNAHGNPMTTPMVTVPAENIVMEKTSVGACKMEKEVSEEPSKDLAVCNEIENISKSEKLEEMSKSSNENIEISKNIIETESKPDVIKTNNISKENLENVPTDSNPQQKQTKRIQSNLKNRHITRKSHNAISLNTMANQYQQLRQLYKKLQRKCLNLEQNVEQLQSLPPIIKTNQQTKAPKSPAPLNTRTKPAHKIESKQFIQSAEKCPTYSCPICSKTFSNSNSLRQHKITHTEERKHVCHVNMCQRAFKRRNGLLQHLKGFHLQVKPFECQVCKHFYALKCDMLRCKHSSLRSNRNIEQNTS